MTALDEIFAHLVNQGLLPPDKQAETATKDIIGHYLQTSYEKGVDDCLIAKNLSERNKTVFLKPIYKP